MSQPELLKRVIGVLDELGVDYMLTGSFASSLQGAPRLTHDIDIVVALAIEDSDRLHAAFEPVEFYLSKEAIHEAVEYGRMFNLLEFASGDKVDFWLLTNSPFDRSRFAQADPESMFGIQVNVSTPEDTILAKLSWAVESGGSRKQLEDVVSVYELQGAVLDLTYVDTWASILGVEPDWNRIKSEVKPL